MSRQAEERTNSSNDKPTKARGGVLFPFPIRLHQLLQAAEKCEALACVISWNEDGTCFRVHDKKAFEQEIQPTYFNQSKYASFRRQLNLWSFQRLSCLVAGGKQNLEGFYAHPLFKRDDEHLCKQMKRRSSDKKIKKNVLPSVTPQAAQQIVYCSESVNHTANPSALTLTNASNVVNHSSNSFLLPQLYLSQKQERSTRPQYNKHEVKGQERSARPHYEQLKLQLHLSELKQAHQRALIASATPHPSSQTSSCNGVCDSTQLHLSQTQQGTTANIRPRSNGRLVVQQQQSYYLNKLRKAYQNTLMDHNKQVTGSTTNKSKIQPPTQIRRHQKQTMLPLRNRKKDRPATPDSLSDIHKSMSLGERRDSCIHDASFAETIDKTCNISNDDADMILEILA